MKTRLEQQIKKMQNELDATVNFANEQHDIFMKDFNSKISGILKSYKSKVVNPSENTFVDKLPIGGDLVYRVYLKTDLSKLSDRQKKNLEQKLREAKVPMPICPISNSSISLVYECK